MTSSNEGRPVAGASGVTGTTAQPGGRTPRTRLLTDVAVGFLPLLATSSATSRVLGFTTSYVALCAAFHVVLAVTLLRHAPPDLPRPGMGWANRVTLFRATLSIPVIALVLHPGRVPEGEAWWIIALAGGALALDGLDGAVARRTTSETEFGARFDMEIDALLIFALSFLVWTSTELGVWVVGIGVTRYLFVAAAYPWPALAGPLPPSFRRKLVCVVQSVALLICLAPPVTTQLRVASALLALAMLLYSFGVDVRWLMARAPDRRSRVP